MKRYIRFGIGILTLILFGYGMYYLQYPLTPKLMINNHVFTYEMAMTERQRIIGLSGRKTLPENHGMLFVFPRKDHHSFWMKDMKFPLDFIWIDDTTVVDITENVPPSNVGEPPTVLSPKYPVNRVFEVRAGTVEKSNIKVGDTVIYLKR
ncbi:MAG: DUF192 domain-containing protein [Patescibacteria group bacterium]|nr:DUF192 domain-containing protein [Patescibacteria group bacterium]